MKVAVTDGHHDIFRVVVPCPKGDDGADARLR